jgi:predicted secreted protein
MGSGRLSAWRRLSRLQDGLKQVGTMPLKHQWTSERIINARCALISLIAMIMAAWFIGGIALHPDGVQRCDQNIDYYYAYHPFGYCGKQGQSHTEAEFRQFEIWRTVLFCLWPLGLAAIAILGRGLSKKVT